jgi:hypothetical protein
MAPMFCTPVPLLAFWKPAQLLAKPELPWKVSVKPMIWLQVGEPPAPLPLR